MHYFQVIFSINHSMLWEELMLHYALEIEENCKQLTLCILSTYHVTGKRDREGVYNIVESSKRAEME